jgi:hypothetical protein
MAMLYGVLSGCTTLREMEAGLTVAEGKLRRLHLVKYMRCPNYSDFMSKKIQTKKKSVAPDLFSSA